MVEKKATNEGPIGDEGESLGDEPRIPIEKAMPGLTVHPLGEGEVWKFAFVLAKVDLGGGETTWSYRTSGVPNREELLGALTVHTDLLRRELVEEWD